MRDRADRRYALLLGVVLALWAMANDLVLSPPDLHEDTPAAVSVEEAPTSG
jgi:hypothetical protein